MPAFIRPKFADGVTIGNWSLERDGKFTDDVWRVRNSDGQVGVIKTARGKKTPWPERFAHEVTTVERLQALPGVLRLLARDTGPSPAWMVTEEATVLTKHLGPTPDVGTVVSAFADIADTLVEAAGLGVAHRDIKPENLFYGRGRAIIGDFGLATGHDYAGLTAHGDRVGPSNFCAPEALEAAETTDWFSADVYALAKSLWVAVVGRRFPPQGPLLVSRRESELLPHAGRASEDLARLLEIATADQPVSRPSISEVRDELRTWLRLHPAGTTGRPDPANYRTAYDEYMSARAVDEGGLPNIVSNAAHKLLDGCRSARASGSRLVDDPPANVDPLYDARAGGDPDWTPEQVAVKKLSWDGAGGVRLVAVAVLDCNDDLRYDLSWQLRTPGTTNWAVTWRAGGRVRMRLPSDIAERARLADEALRHTPPELDGRTTKVDAETEDKMRRIVTGIRRREATRTLELSEARLRVEARHDAAQAARDDLTRFWDDLVSHLNSVIDNELLVRSTYNDDSWILTIGDRRVVIKVAEPATHLGPAVLVGTLVVETEHPNAFKSVVANVCAIVDPSGDPVWQLIRFNRNDLAQPPVRVSEALHDGAGAVAIDILDDLLGGAKTFPQIPGATVATRSPLDVDTLLTLIVAEVSALDDQATREPDDSGPRRRADR